MITLIIAIFLYDSKSWTHRCINDRVSLVFLFPVFVPGVVPGLHLGFVHLVHTMIRLDAVRLGVERGVLALWQHVQVCDCRETKDGSNLQPHPL